MTPQPPASHEVDRLLWRALEEDLGAGGDVTTQAVVPPEAVARGAIVARTAGRCAGLGQALRSFSLLDPAVDLRLEVTDGEPLEAGQVMARIQGPAGAILTAERTALNLLGRLSGIASATAMFVEEARQHGSAIAATRKTTPGLRALEKYAVMCGGGIPHRFGLSDGILIKDNHIAVAGGIVPAIERARLRAHHLLKIQVEIDELGQLPLALRAGADAVLLDNMQPAQLSEAVAMVDGACLTEASGGVSLDRVAQIASTGVDLISVGWITHSAPSLDVGLDLELG